MDPFNMPSFQRSVVEKESFYRTPASGPNDIICPGSDDDETPEETRRKHLRYEEEARRVAAGRLPLIQSASLRGPFSTAQWTWKSPWGHKRALPAKTDDEVEETRYEDDAEMEVNDTMCEDDLEVDKGHLEAWRAMAYPDLDAARIAEGSEGEDWWRPGSEDMLFTKERVLKRAAQHGMGHLAPREALLWCKNTAAEEAIRQESVGGEILMSVEDDDNKMDAEDSIGNRALERESLSSFLAQPSSTGFLESQMPHDYNYMSDATQQVRSEDTSKGKKRRRESQWLKGSHVSKRARWDDGPISTPTPLSGALERNRKIKSSKLRQESVYRDPGHASCSFPVRLSPANSPVRFKDNASPRSVSIGKEQSPNPKISSSKYQKVSKTQAVRLRKGPPEDIDELSGNSQGPLPRLPSPTKSRERLSNRAPNTSFSDLEEDDLVADTPRPKLQTPTTSGRRHLVSLKSSTKLPKLSAHEEEVSFVTEVAPSSRNAEEFKFKKKKKRSTESRGAEHVGVNGVSAPISEKRIMDNNRTTVDLGDDGDLLELHHAAPEPRERGSIPRSLRKFDTSWDVMEDAMRPAKSDTRRERSSSKHSSRKRSSRTTSTGLTGPSIAPHRSSSPPAHTPLVVLPSQMISAKKPGPELLSSKNATPRQPRSASSSVRGSLKRDFMAGLLPKFDWEDEGGSEMDRIQMALSQNCPSSSSEFILREKLHFEEVVEQMQVDQERNSHHVDKDFALSQSSPRETSHVTDNVFIGASCPTPMKSQSRRRPSGKASTVVAPQESIALEREDYLEYLITEIDGSTPQKRRRSSNVPTSLSKPPPSISPSVSAAPVPKADPKDLPTLSAPISKKSRPRRSSSSVPASSSKSLIASSIPKQTTLEPEKADVEQTNESSLSSEFHTTESPHEIAISRRNSPVIATKPMSSLDQNDISTQSYYTTESGSRRQLLSSQMAKSQLPVQSYPEPEDEQDVEEDTILGDGEASEVDSDLGSNSASMIAGPTEGEDSVIAVGRSRDGTLELPAQLPENSASETAVEVNETYLKPNARSPVLPTSEVSRQGFGPQSPWVAEPSQPLPLLTTTHPIAPISFERSNGDRIDISKDLAPRHNSGDPDWQHVRHVETPVTNIMKSFVNIQTPIVTSSTILHNSGVKQTSSQQILGTATKNPWMSCLKNKSLKKPRSNKRVSFGGLPDDQGEGSESQQLPGSPPPPENKAQDDEAYDEDSPMVKKFGNHFNAARGFTQILPDHTISQDINSSPALSAQADAFIAADREISAEKEPETTGEHLPRFLQPRSDASDNAIWGNRDEQSPFRVEPQESPTHVPHDTIPEFNMEAALGEMSDFLTGDWSIEAEMKKVRETTGTSERRDTGFRRRRLFGFV